MRNEDRIQPYSKNPFYWQYKAKPVVLVGGSVEDNLFQIPDIEAHLDLLAQCGGNYVRCTMSSRDEGDVWPFYRNPDTGYYDLERMGDAYWQRFERFLTLTAERDIIIQIEVWDRFDFARDPWQDNPFNPKNNVNYTAAETGMMEVITTHPGRMENCFFRSVPERENNESLLRYQHKFVDALLARSLDYGHVLYCMDNETNEAPSWGAYWATYIQNAAKAQGVLVNCTEMWDAHNLLHDEHKATFDHPELYAFVDISQNNHRPADAHWENPQVVRKIIRDSGVIRPMNSVKIYGANSGQYGSTRDAQERMWRNILGGLATSRFHRPPAGLGLNAIAQAHIRSMRMFLSAVDVTRCEPNRALVLNKSWNEAYCTAEAGKVYAVFFPDGGNVQLDVSAVEGDSVNVRWLDIRQCRWCGAAKPVAIVHGQIPLVTPTEEGYWTAVVTV